MFALDIVTLVATCPK